MKNTKEEYLKQAFEAEQQNFKNSEGLKLRLDEHYHLRHASKKAETSTNKGPFQTFFHKFSWYLIGFGTACLLFILVLRNNPAGINSWFIPGTKPTDTLLPYQADTLQYKHDTL